MNDICHEDPKTCRSVQWLTPEELYDKVKIDDLYFQATGGGICFGGGEPLIYSDFICEFKRICNPRWKIAIETSGVGSWVDFEDLAPVVDQWFVDVKTLDPFTYENYTGEFFGVLQHLYCIKRLIDLDKVFLKVPHIPNFTTKEDVARSIEKLKKEGFKNIIETTYIIRNGNESR